MEYKFQRGEQIFGSLLSIRTYFKKQVLGSQGRTRLTLFFEFLVNELHNGENIYKANGHVED